jgi:hypothetical protein
MEKLRYLFGPLPASLCVVHFVLFNSITVGLLLFINAISIFRDKTYQTFFIPIVAPAR